VIYGNGNPDAVCEGLVSYNGADWAAACGRWATRYLNGLSLNVVMPGVWVLLYMLTVFAVVVLLAKLWGIHNKLHICLISALLAVNPAVIEQSLLQYMFMAWGVSNLLGVLFVYVNMRCESKALRYVFAPICVSVAFGLYQVSMGIMCLCFGISLILKLVDGRSFKDCAIQALRCVISAVIGTALYFATFKLEMLRYGIGESGRVQAFSIGEIFSQLSQTIPAAYKAFYGYFADYIFYRKYLYMLLFLALAVLIAVETVRLLRKKCYGEAAAVLILTGLLPMLANVTKLGFPETDIKDLMQFQSNLIVPFLLALVERQQWSWQSLKNLGRCGACLVLAVLNWGYMVSANATYSVYELSYRHTEFVTSSILTQVYEMPDYDTSDTIIFAGFIDDTELRNTIGAYKFAYGQYDNLVYWTDAGTGLRQSRNNYLMDYFGISGGYIKGTMHGAYNEAVQSEEFAEMGIYPAENSIKRFDNMIIVKLSDNPPIFD
jgi:hypothetical protein